VIVTRNRQFVGSDDYHVRFVQVRVLAQDERLERFQPVIHSFGEVGQRQHGDAGHRPQSEHLVRPVDADADHGCEDSETKDDDYGRLHTSPTFTLPCAKHPHAQGHFSENLIHA